MDEVRDQKNTLSEKIESILRQGRVAQITRSLLFDLIDQEAHRRSVVDQLALLEKIRKEASKYFYSTTIDMEKDEMSLVELIDLERARLVGESHE